MAEDLAQQPAGQVPKIFGSHSLEGVSSAELRKDDVNPVAQAAQQRAPLRGPIALFGAVGCQQRDAHAPLELFPPLRRPVIAIPEGEAASGLEQFGEHGKLVGVCRSHPDAGDQPRPAHPNMHPEAVEGLLEEGVFAEGGFSLEAATAVGTGEQARWQRHGVHQREGRVVGGEREELLPEALLYLPEVGALTGEGGAVHLAKGWEALGVVWAEEEVDSLESVSMPRNSPTISMVRTSASESFGAGPR